jgi:prepilin-type N-terminal cleavage/methylation domain-containing protein
VQPARSTPRNTRRGFTLIELIMVMGLVAVLLGTGVGMLSSLNLGRRAAVGLVQNVIRSARNSAVARSAPARVRIDTAENTILAQGTQVIGTWHFESDAISGGLGLDGVSAGAAIIEDGYIGRAVSFAGARKGAVVEIRIQDDPGFDLREGFTLDCALRLDAPDGGRALNVGGVLGLETNSRGQLRAWMKPAVLDKSGEESAGGFLAIDAPGDLLRIGSWVRVRVDYDRRVFRLFVDGIEVARDDEESPVWHIEGPLVLGDPRASFAGSIDNLVISAVVDSELAQLPKGVTFHEDAPKRISFAPQGFLDREVHSAPVAFHLDYDDGTQVLVRVGLYGTVE